MIEVRSLSTGREFEDAVVLQRAIWGFQDVELLPARLFVVAKNIGGHAFGAFDGDRLIGFCLAIPGLKGGERLYLHSHMLGVLPEYRNAGVGRMLKLRQREDALARGINLLEWTFDPLEIKNAYFNLERLGAVVRRYVENQYGTTSSPLHGGLPTDRCVAEWWLASERVERVLRGDLPPRAVVARVEVPSEIARLRRENPKDARRIQVDIGEGLRGGFDRGLAVIGFEKSAGGGAYLLGPWEPQRPADTL